MSLNRSGRKPGVPNRHKAFAPGVHPLVRELLSYQTISDAALASRAGYAQANFPAMRRGAHTPSLRTFIALANALDLDVTLTPKEPK